MPVCAVLKTVCRIHIRLSRIERLAMTFMSMKLPYVEETKTLLLDIESLSTPRASSVHHVISALRHRRCSHGDAQPQQQYRVARINPSIRRFLWNWSNRPRVRRAICKLLSANYCQLNFLSVQRQGNPIDDGARDPVNLWTGSGL